MAGQEGRARWSPTPTGSRTPSLFLVGLGVEGKEVEERKERGNPTPGGSRTPLGRAIERDGTPPPPLLYIRGGRHPLEIQQLILEIS